jgi:hypothetical protein
MFGSPSQKQTIDSQLRIQTALQGKAIPLAWGQPRLACNLIWYGDFSSHGGGSGGKGGGGKGSSSVTYSASLIMSLCETPIAAFGTVWVNATASSLAALDLAGFGGGYSQTPWSYLTSIHPDQALAYRGLSYVAGAAFNLGNSSSLPNLTVEARMVISNAYSGVPDADPAPVMTDFLTNPTSGVGFPSAFLGDLTTWSNYCIANGLVVSPVITDQAEARQFIQDLLDATNSAAVWSGGLLKVVPYGDTSITANGRTYTAPSAPLYTLGDADFKPPQGSNPSSATALSSSDPVQVSIKRPSDQQNSFTIEFLDRTNTYNATVIEAPDDASIEEYGLRRTPKTLHFFCLQSAAMMSAQLMLGRQAVLKTFSVTLGAEYILLDPMDIVALSDPALGVSPQWVRITEITENADATLTFFAEEYLAGTASAPLYAAQPGLAVNPGWNTPVASVIAPVIFEPTYAAAGATEIWIAIGAPANFGGADIWVSTDNSTFTLAGTFDGNSRVGILTGGLPSVPPASPGLPTIDATNTLTVSMAETGAQLLSGTHDDAQSANTICYVGGEFLSYATATLGAGSTYSLSYLVRGQFDSAPVASSAGTPLVRLSSGSYFRFPLSDDRIGATLYFKILPVNAFGGGQPTLDEVSSYPYTVQGVALAEALAAPTNLSTSYIAQYTALSWREVSDWRGPDYEIRKGSSWASGLRLGSVAHPPFTVYGDDTYWVAAVVAPAPGVVVYSAPVSVSIQGSAIVTNVAATWDEFATAWTGTLGGGAVISGSIVTTGGGPTSQVSGTYEIPTGHEIDVGRACACNVLINWSSAGYPAGQNVLSITDWLAISDFLGAASASAVQVYPEIAISQDGSTWGAWQRFVPGAYVGRKFKARMQIQTTDPATQAALLTFTFFVSAPERDDHYMALSVPSGGLTLSFKPDGSGAAVPFNGGPGSASVPAIQGTIIGGSSGDTLIVSSESLSGCTVQVQNGGSGVARTVNLLVQGY